MASQKQQQRQEQEPRATAIFKVVSATPSVLPSAERSRFAAGLVPGLKRAERIYA